MPEYAITVVSHDRPGLIADITAVLAELGGNLESSSMSLLQGHFAWTLVVALDGSADEVRARLLPVCPNGVSVLPLDEAEELDGPVDRVLVSVHGVDRIGIVARVSRLLADAGGNIVELTTHLHGGMYLANAEVVFAQRVDVEALDEALGALGEELGVAVHARRMDLDVL